MLESMKEQYEIRLTKINKDHEESVKTLSTVKIMGIKLKSDVERMELKEQIARQSAEYDKLMELQDQNESKLSFFKWRVIT